MNDQTPRVIAEFSDYVNFMRALRLRAAELKASGETLDELTGLPTRYVGKLLGPRPIRRVGMTSLGPLLGALGVKLVLVEDHEAMRRFGKRNGVGKRNETVVRNGVVTIELSRRHMQRIGRLGGRARFNIDPKLIKKLARAAGKARQAKRRLADAAIVNWKAAKAAIKRQSALQK